MGTLQSLFWEGMLWETLNRINSSLTNSPWPEGLWNPGATVVPFFMRAETDMTQQMEITEKLQPSMLPSISSQVMGTSFSLKHFFVVFKDHDPLNKKVDTAFAKSFLFDYT